MSVKLFGIEQVTHLYVVTNFLVTRGPIFRILVTESFDVKLTGPTRKAKLMNAIFA